MPASRNIEEKILRRCAACRGTAYGCDGLLPSGEPREVSLSVGYQQEGMLAVKRSTGYCLLADSAPRMMSTIRRWQPSCPFPDRGYADALQHADVLRNRLRRAGSGKPFKGCCLDTSVSHAGKGVSSSGLPEDFGITIAFVSKKIALLRHHDERGPILTNMKQKLFTDSFSFFH